MPVEPPELDLSPDEYRNGKAKRGGIFQKGGLIRLAIWIGAIVAISYVYRSMMQLDLWTVVLICVPVTVLCLGLAALLDRGR